MNQKLMVGLRNLYSKIHLRGWKDSSLRKMLVLQTWGLVFDAQKHPHLKKTCTVIYLSTVETEAEWSICFVGQLTSSKPVRDTVSKIKWWMVLKEWSPNTHVHICNCINTNAHTHQKKNLWVVSRLLTFISITLTSNKMITTIIRMRKTWGNKYYAGKLSYW